MKKLHHYIWVILLCVSLQSSAQVIDLRTGVVNGSGSPGTLIGINSPDDTWTVCLPGNNYTLPGSYIPIRCGTGVLDGSGWAPSGPQPPDYPYAGLDPNVRWLAPYMNAQGEHLKNSPKGAYYYRTTFEQICEVQSAVFNFSFIGGDNKIDQIIVNGNIYSVNYPFYSWTNTTLPISHLDINVGSTNEILVRVINDGSYTGMIINGNLTITSGPPDPGFYVQTPNGSTVFATSTANGNHTWEVYMSGTGNQGTYVYHSTYNSPNLYLFGGGPCYMIKHTVSNSCGTTCASQSVCFKSCNSDGCADLTPPSGLQWDQASDILSWVDVSGATSYIVTITPNDPACCGNSFHNPPQDITVQNNMLDLRAALSERPGCFSWSVKAVCPDGNTASSEKKCVSGGGILGKTDLTQQGTNMVEQNTTVNVFPNPTKGNVSFDIETANDTELMIIITDISGRTVKTFDKVKTTQKKTSITWNAETLAEGVYLVKITTSQNQVITKKLIIE